MRTIENDMMSDGMRRKPDGAYILFHNIANTLVIGAIELEAIDTVITFKILTFLLFA